MYVDTAPYKRNGKTYKRYLLRESYREDGKVKKKTIASLNKLSQDEINAIKLALKHKNNLENLSDVSQSKIVQGKSYGAVLVLKKIAKEMGVTKVLGSDKEGIISLWQIIGRVLFQGSRLSLIRGLKIHAANEIIGIQNDITPSMLYTNLCWLEKNQEEIENKLQSYYGKDDTNLYLYDVTSSYLEGEFNELAEYGYNRDKKKGKKQIVIGLLTNSSGYPIAVRVFKGNTSDSTTIGDQVEILKEKFKAKKIVLVGDRAMFSKQKIEDLPDDFSYITAISKKQIEKLIDDSLIQLSLFDEKLEEVELENVRYIMRCNPIRKQEIKDDRDSKIKSIQKKIDEKNQYLTDHKKASTDVAVQNINNYIEKLKVNKFITLSSIDRVISINIDIDELKNISKLDGCYCLKTNLKSDEVSKESVHNRYKDLKLVESAFRAMKQSHLEIRPLFLRREDRTKAHIFIVMLGYLILKKLEEYWKDSDLTTTEALSALSTLTVGSFTLANINITRPMAPNELCKNLIDLTNTKIPRYI